MSTTDLEYFVRLPSTLFADEAPVDAVDAYSLASNALHLADECGQVLCAWSAVGSFGSSVGVRVDSDQVSNTPANDEWFRIWMGGPWLLRVREDGTPYPIRARMSGHMAGSNNGSFRLVLGPIDRTQSALERDANGDNVLAFTTSSTSSSVYNASDVLTLSDDQIRRATQATLGRDAATLFRETVGVQVYATVWAKGETDGDGPRLTYVSLAEYIGT